MKNNILYYLHEVDADQNRKFRKLRGIIGWDAEGRFWALNNIIGKADACLLDIDNEDIFEDIAHRLEMNYRDCKAFLRTVEECKLIYRVGKKITTQGCQEALKSMNKQRDYDRRKRGQNPIRNEDASGTETEDLPIGNEVESGRILPQSGYRGREEGIKEREGGNAPPPFSFEELQQAVNDACKSSKFKAFNPEEMAVKFSHIISGNDFKKANGKPIEKLSSYVYGLLEKEIEFQR